MFKAESAVLNQLSEANPAEHGAKAGRTLTHQSVSSLAFAMYDGRFCPFARNRREAERGKCAKRSPSQRGWTIARMVPGNAC